MKITAFNSSPRKEKGVTYIMVEDFLAGARSVGAETEHILLAEKNIQPCIGCFACWFKKPGTCALRDDMRGLLTAYMQSDIVIFASPVYVGTVSGSMKNFIDRLLPLYDPRYEEDAQGRFCHVWRYERYPDAVLISNCAFPDNRYFDFFRPQFDFMKIVYRMKVLAEIFLGGGFLLQGFVPGHDDAAERYRLLLQTCGQEIGRQRRLSPASHAALQKPLVPLEETIASGNSVFEALLADLSEKQPDLLQD
jgi:hypothetical protein